MSIGSQIAWDDTILPFQLDKTDIRGRVARMDQILDEILAQHDYPDVIEQLVCEAVMLTVLIGQTMKLRYPSMRCPALPMAMGIGRGFQ